MIERIDVNKCSSKNLHGLCISNARTKCQRQIVTHIYCTFCPYAIFQSLNRNLRFSSHDIMLL